MSIVNEVQVKMYKGVAVMRDSLPMAQIFYDLHVDNDGFAAYAVWQRNTYRIPFISHVRDFWKRKKRGSSTRENLVKNDYRNFFVKFENVQGIVADRERKEVQILTNEEQLTVLFRPVAHFNEFLELISSNIEEKIFYREDHGVQPSLYVS